MRMRGERERVCVAEDERRPEQSKQSSRGWRTNLALNRMKVACASSVRVLSFLFFFSFLFFLSLPENVKCETRNRVERINSSSSCFQLELEAWIFGKKELCELLRVRH